MVHTYELSIPVLIPIWLTEFSVIDVGFAQFPVNEATVGALVTVGFALFGLGALPSGVLVDRVDARVLITACLVGMGASFLLLAVSPTPAVIGLAMAVWGVAASVYHPSGLSLISRGVEQRGSAFAYHGMAGNVGIAVGPLLTILLLLAFDWRVVVAILAVPAALAALYAFRADIDERAAVAAADGGDGSTDGNSRAGGGVDSLGDFLSQSRHLFAGAFVVVFAVTLCSGLYYRGVLTFLPELLDNLEIAALAPVEFGGRTLQPSRYVYVGLLMVGVGGQFVAGKLTDRGRPEFGILAGFGALAVVAVLFLPAAALGLPALLVVSALLGFFLFFVQPFYQASVAEYTPAGTRGLSYGFTYLGVFGVGALGATLAGAMLTYFAPQQLFLALAGLAVVAAGLGTYLVTQAPSTAVGT
ncbi:Predicted arabinose efflux permease, MFS family [Halorientalis regularis]|uniref:Predicted arabinose efflux permease, MFS family n=2 Tax=Halorientalis regularis TaxID=660518 RepID=A0A1G7FLJ1_9EURY|nr:MFS transporter [Halorientalis regularis]SDE76525.1 Predicted arabinose efflux permease, MFS family [Halorientalis regularis]